VTRGGGMGIDFYLFGLCAFAALSCAVIYWLAYAAAETQGLPAALIKTASTGFIAAAALTLVAARGPAEAWPLVLGVALGAVGDWCLARPGERSFLAGMAAFGMGHLAYVWAMAALLLRAGFDGWSPAEIAAGLLLLGLVVSTEFWLAPRTGALRLPVRVYVGLIAAMGAALLLLPGGAGTREMRIGGALFILSDLLLAIRLFVVTDPGWRRTLGRILWPIYWLGQVLLVLAGLEAWGAIAGILPMAGQSD